MDKENVVRLQKCAADVGGPFTRSPELAASVSPE